jgi:hypothetical protein
MRKLDDLLDGRILAAVAKTDRTHRKEPNRELVANARSQCARGRPIRAAAATLDKAHKRLAHARKLAKALLRETGGSSR